ncbi:MAG TPA: PAS domain S-box protein [Verrucomicrobiae bacterium]|nr:PAS domain S-box protein [Verrucomicrobiae bacterium]
MAVDGVQPTPSPGPEPGPRPARPPLGTYDAESLARCRRGAAMYCLAAGMLLLAFGALDPTRFPDAAAAVLLVRGAGAAALGLVLLLVWTRFGARHPRALGVIAAATVGAIEQVLGLAAGAGAQGAESPINLGTTFAMLGAAVLIPWSPVWSAFACMLVVGEYVGTAIGTGQAAGLLFGAKLTLFVAAGVVAVVITAVLDRRRWREFLQTWALAAAHREAREREKRYRSVVETAGSIIVVLAPQGSVAEFNREAERVLGWSQEAAVGRDFLSSFVTQASRPTVAADIRMALAGEPTRAFEARMLARDGSERMMACGTTRLVDDDGRTMGVLLCAQDVSARKRIEEALRQSEARLRAVIDGAPVVLFALDRAGTLTFSGGKGLARLGLEPGQRVGQPIGDALARTFAPAKSYFDRALAGEPVAWTGSLADATFECRLMPVADAGGGLAGLIGLAIDVTERTQAEEARLALERRLHEAQKLESLGVLASGIAHDFNNLLVSVLGNASLALGELPPHAPACEALRRIERAARRGSELTREMLAYAGKDTIALERVDVNAVVEETSDLLSVSIGSKVAMAYDLAPGLPPIEGDPTQIRQVIMNLVINASEAIGGAEGTITVHTGLVELGPEALRETLHPSEAAPGPHVCVEVRDTGCGMDAGTMAKVFDPFFSTKLTGRGLGLATVLGVVRAHHGALAVTSAPGGGTTFRVYLPAAAAVARVEPPIAASAPDPGKSREERTVLLVDDEDDVRAVTAHMLERLGCSVLQAGDGREGVDVFRAHARTIDAVIVDLTLPRLSGDRVFREIRTIRPDACVILMSGYSDEKATDGLAEAGLAGFLRKPFSVADLEKALGDAARAAE